MFNDIFGVVLWKGLIEDKPADPGENTGNKKSQFSNEMSSSQDIQFFHKCRILQFLGTHKKYIKF